LGGLGYILINLRPSYDEARQYFEQSVSRYRSLGDQIGLSEALTNLSAADRYLNRLPQSIAFAREAYALAQASGNLHLIALAASNLCAALLRTSATLEEADTVGRTALTLIQELGHQAELPSMYFRLGTVVFNQGRYAEARMIFTSGLAVARRLGDALEICTLLYGLAWVALAEGANQDALRLAEESITVSVRLGEGFFRLQMLALNSLAARRLGDGVRARADAVAALHFALLARTLDDAPLWAAALLLADCGAPERAAEVFALCEQMYLADNIPWRDIALRELRAIVAALPPKVAATARTRWVQCDYWAALEELLVELEAAGWREG
jgi:tetratricopeptide (TPR) repeat protein